jgi:lipopolysaccharide export system permease protein
MAMRGIFFRHVLRSVSQATVAVAVVLLVVLFAYQISFVLGRAADGQLPGALVLELAGLTLRGNLTIILPFAVVLGVVLGLGRHYHDSEISAAHAGGIGRGTLFGAAGTVTLAAAALAAWIAFVDGPAAARGVVQLRTEALRTAITRGLAPGQFRALGKGTTLYFRSADADGSMRDVFLQRDLPETMSGGRRIQVVLAGRAQYSVSADGGHYTIVLGDGHTYEGTPGERDWRITQFGQQTIRVPTPQASLPGRPRLDMLRTGELLRSPDKAWNAELHWRTGWVLNVIVLGFLAVPLARLRPGQGPHARVPWAVLLFALYAGLLTTGRLMLERGEIPGILGLWWVHAGIIVLVLATLRPPRWRAAGGGTQGRAP